MTFEFENLFPRPGIPNPNRHIPAGRCQALPVGRKSHAVDTVCMSLEFEELTPRLDVPQANRAVRASKRETLPVGRKCNRCDRTRVLDKCAEFLPGRGVP